MGSKILTGVGFSVLFSLAAACGGTKQEAKAPEADTTDSAKTGSSGSDPAEAALLKDAPAPTSQKDTTPQPTNDPPKGTTKSSTADGSDIVPPFSGGSAAATTASADTKASKSGKTKKGTKKKKKGDATAMNP